MSKTVLTSEELKSHAEHALQIIVDKQSEILQNYLSQQYQKYLFWRKFIPIGRVREYNEYCENFNIEHLSLGEFCRYKSMTSYKENEAERLKALLGLCQINKHGTIELTASDVLILNYPTKSFIPLPKEEKEKLIAEIEMNTWCQQ